MSGTSEPQGGGDAHFGRSAGTLSIGVGLAGLLTYAYFSLASHNLDSTSYGEVVVLWSSVFLSISLLHRPVEQYLSRTVAHHRERGEQVGPTVRVAARIQAALALAFAIAVLVLREPIEDGLFSGEEALYWIYVAAVLCFAASFFARGYLAGSQQFGLLAGLLICESVARTLFAVALGVGVVDGQDGVALGIAAAPVFSLLVVPLALRRRGGADDRSRVAAPAETARSLAHGGAFAAAVFWIMLSEQVLLNGGPLFVRGLEGAAAAGFIFNVLMLARAPLLVFQGVAISLLPHLTRLRSRADSESRTAFDVSVGQTLKAVAAFTVLVATIVAVAGPALMEAAFGSRFEYDRAGLLIVTAAMGFYLAATTLNQATLAHGRARQAALAWLGSATAFLVWSALPLIDEVDLRIETGFAISAALLCAALWRVSQTPGADDQATAPGSAEEIAARLALADEAS